MFYIEHIYTYYNKETNDFYEDIELGLPRQYPLYEIVIETYFPKVFEFFLKSTATSKILPWVTVIILA